MHSTIQFICYLMCAFSLVAGSPKIQHRAESEQPWSALFKPDQWQGQLGGNIPTGNAEQFQQIQEQFTKNPTEYRECFSEISGQSTGGSSGSKAESSSNSFGGFPNTAQFQKVQDCVQKKVQQQSSSFNPSSSAGQSSGSSSSS